MNVYVICYNIGNRNRSENLEVLAQDFCQATEEGLKEILKLRGPNEYYNLFQVEKTRRTMLLKAV